MIGMYADHQARDAVRLSRSPWWRAVADALADYGEWMSPEGVEAVSLGTREMDPDGRISLSTLGKYVMRNDFMVVRHDHCPDCLVTRCGQRGSTVPDALVAVLEDGGDCDECGEGPASHTCAPITVTFAPGMEHV